jgi:hypothetical protein
MLDGWNIGTNPTTTGLAAKPNLEADPAHWPTTGLPFATVGLR